MQQEENLAIEKEEEGSVEVELPIEEKEEKDGLSVVEEKETVEASDEKSEQEDTVTVGGKSLIEFWYKVKVPKLNNEGWVFGGCLTEKSKTTKKLLSINDLKKEYKNLPNNCETIFQYIFPNSKVAQNIVNENHQLQLQNKEFNNYPFFEIITNIFNKTNEFVKKTIHFQHKSMNSLRKRCFCAQKI